MHLNCSNHSSHTVQRAQCWCNWTRLLCWLKFLPVWFVFWAQSYSGHGPLLGTWYNTIQIADKYVACYLNALPSQCLLVFLSWLVQYSRTSSSLFTASSSRNPPAPAGPGSVHVHVTYSCPRAKSTVRKTAAAQIPSLSSLGSKCVFACLFQFNSKQKFST